MIIKKLNSVFHRHSKWLFGAFTIVIIISFMGFLTPGQFGLDMFSSPEDRVVGTAFGENVTIGELRDQARNLSLAYQLVYGVPRQDIDMQQAFWPLCIQRAAANMGITASDTEVADLIKRSPIFQTDGVFDMAKYKKMMENFRRSGIPDQEVMQSLREMVIMNKVNGELTSGVTVTAGEAENFYRMQNTSYKLRVAAFNAAGFMKSVKLNAEEVRKFYESNVNAYMVKGKLSALVAMVKYSNFKAQAEKLATDAALLKFYKADPKAFAKANEKNTPEFKAVKNLVRKEFIANTCKELAGQSAYNFASKAFDAVNEAEKGKLAAFKTAAVEAKLPLVETGMVEFDAVVGGAVKSGELFAQLAKIVQSQPVTNVVLAEDAAYVGFLLERVEAAPAQFETVASKVGEDYRKVLAVKAAQAAAQKAATELSAITDSGKRLLAFARLKDCTFANAELSMEKQANPEYSALLLPAMELQIADTTPAVDTADGAIIGLLEKRIPPDMKGFEAKKAMCEQTFRYYKSQMAMQNFQQKLASQCRLELPDANR